VPVVELPHWKLRQRQRQQKQPCKESLVQLHVVWHPLQQAQHLELLLAFHWLVLVQFQVQLQEQEQPVLL
jgi:hypothetical protein